MAPSNKYDKIYTVTSVHHLIPIKLDLAKLNYTHWSTLFSTHCHAFNVHSFLEAASTTDPPDEETRNADAVVLSWIFLTISEPLLERVLNMQPKTSHDAWEFLKKIFHDNKRSKIVELTAELRSLHNGDLTAEQYFRKVESISALLSNLGSTIKDEELVTYAINGLNDRFPHAQHIIIHSDPFPNFETVRSVITLEEMQLTRKNRITTESQGTPSAPTVLVAQTTPPSTITPRLPSTPEVYRNFNRGHCRFADKCRYLHHSTPRTPTPTISSRPNGNNQARLLEIIAAQQQLLLQQGHSRASFTPAAQLDFRPYTPLHT
ncbi:uncharacterized protein [Rutidosis leptorrhynchoides]|uniref:uncharacterized protein n=1 Tax=Rutidosis leptorrhynchoides TaxID=125765 RepID=UPI003A9977E7